MIAGNVLRDQQLVTEEEFLASAWSRDFLAPAEFGRILTDANQRSIQILKDKQIPVLKISDEDRARLGEMGTKYVDEWVARADAAGLDGRALVDDYTALVAEFTTQRDEQGYP